MFPLSLWLRDLQRSFSGEEEDTEIASHPIRPEVDPSPPAPLSPPGSPDSSAETQYGVVLDMVQKLNSELGMITLDNDKIRTVCEKLLGDRDRDHAMCDLTGLVKRSLDRPLEHLPQPDAFKPHPIIRPDLIDSDGNLRATDIGITWEGSETFFQGENVVASDDLRDSLRDLDQLRRPATSTPYQPMRDHGRCNISTPRQPPTIPTCLEIPDTCTPLRQNNQEGRQRYRPAAPIQRFNNKSLNWLSWFRHFRAVADVHGWDKSQRALQLVSYLEETAMNVAQELGDDELYDYDILLKLLGDRFDMADYGVIMRMQIHLLTLSQTYVVSATHRAHRSFVRS